VTRIYVDAEVLAVPGSGERRIDPTAAPTLRFLVDAGHEVVVVATGGAGPAAVGPGGAMVEALPRELVRGVVESVPARPTTAGWYLTTSVDRCQGSSARTRTVLIGGTPAAGAIHRCDAVARDLRAAVLEILASEAMPS
jgi:hypothetical protein